MPKKIVPKNLGFFMFLRYMLLFLFVLTNIFSFLLPQATIKASFYIISIFTQATLTNSTITFQSHSIEIIPACIALSAYYLLLILNLSTPMPIKKRMYSLILTFALLFLVNVFRIAVFSFIFVSSQSLFTAFHFITWILLSSIIVFLVWYTGIKVFGIKGIPVYSDLKFLVKQIRV